MEKKKQLYCYRYSYGFFFVTKFIPYFILWFSFCYLGFTKLNTKEKAVSEVDCLLILDQILVFVSLESIFFSNQDFGKTDFLFFRETWVSNASHDYFSFSFNKLLIILIYKTASIFIKQTQIHENNLLYISNYYSFVYLNKFHNNLIIF